VEDGRTCCLKDECVEVTKEECWDDDLHLESSLQAEVLVVPASGYGV
jgi:hypothetical protein